MLFGAIFAAGWTWFAVVMGANIALSLYYYVRILVPLYLRPSTAKHLHREPIGLRIALLLLGLGTGTSGVFPQV